MSVNMTERIRILFDTDEEIRLAVRLAATKADMSVSDLLNQMIRRELADEIKDAKKYLPKKKPGGE
jgi:hypothetical protein